MSETPPDDSKPHWFGRSWGAALNKEWSKQPTPVGQRCNGCRQPIERGDQGVTMPVFGQFSKPPRRVALHFFCFMQMPRFPGAYEVKKTSTAPPST